MRNRLVWPVYSQANAKLRVSRYRMGVRGAIQSALACPSETRTTVASHLRSRNRFLPSWLYVIILSKSYQISWISGRPGLIGEVACSQDTKS